MKRVIIALGIAAVVFGGVFGLAASLSATSTTLGAGSAVVASCQTSGSVGVDYAPSFDSSVPGFNTAVDLSNIHADCIGKTYKVVLTDASYAQVGTEGTGSVTGATETVNITGANAKNVTGAHVTIYG